MQAHLQQQHEHRSQPPAWHESGDAQHQPEAQDFADNGQLGRNNQHRPQTGAESDQAVIQMASCLKMHVPSLTEITRPGVQP